MDTLLNVMGFIVDYKDYAGEYGTGLSVGVRIAAFFAALLFIFFARHGYRYFKAITAIAVWVVFFLVSGLVVTFELYDFPDAVSVIICLAIASLAAWFVYRYFEKIFGVLCFVLFELIGFLLAYFSWDFTRPVALVVATVISAILTYLIVKFTKPVIIIVTGIYFGTTAGELIGIAFNLPDVLTAIAKFIVAFIGIFTQIRLYGFIYDEGDTAFDSDAAYQKLLQIDEDYSNSDVEGAASANSGKNHNIRSTDPVTKWVRSTYDVISDLKSRIKIQFRAFKKNWRGYFAAFASKVKEVPGKNKKTVVICTGAVIVLILLAVGVKKAVTAIVDKVSSKSDYEEEADYGDFRSDYGDFDRDYDDFQPDYDDNYRRDTEEVPAVEKGEIAVYGVENAEPEISNRESDSQEDGDEQKLSDSEDMVLTHSEANDVASLEAYAAEHGEKVNFHSYATDSMGESLYATLGPDKPDYIMFYGEEVDSYCRIVNVDENGINEIDRINLIDRGTDADGEYYDTYSPVYGFGVFHFPSEDVYYTEVAGGDYDGIQYKYSVADGKRCLVDSSLYLIDNLNGEIYAENYFDSNEGYYAYEQVDVTYEDGELRQYSSVTVEEEQMEEMFSNYDEVKAKCANELETMDWIVLGDYDMSGQTEDVELLDVRKSDNDKYYMSFNFKFDSYDLDREFNLYHYFTFRPESNILIEEEDASNLTYKIETSRLNIPVVRR